MTFPRKQLPSCSSKSLFSSADAIHTRVFVRLCVRLRLSADMWITCSRPINQTGRQLGESSPLRPPVPTGNVGVESPLGTGGWRGGGEAQAGL